MEQINRQKDLTEILINEFKKFIETGYENFVENINKVKIKNNNIN